MRKLLLLLILCMACFVGCNDSLFQTNSKVISQRQANDDRYTGLWQHTIYPDAHSITVYEYTNSNISFMIQSLRGNASQVATAIIKDIPIINGKGDFDFVDSFENAGVGTISFSENELVISYEVTASTGGWCIAAGAGTYIKTKELAELEDFDVSYYKNYEYESDTIGEVSEVEVNPLNYFWYEKYVKMVEDNIYDDDIALSIYSGNFFTIENYQEDDSFEPNESGEYKVLTSDKPEYDFKLSVTFHDGSTRMWYAKVIFSKDLIEFYSYSVEDDTISFFGKYARQGYAHSTYGYDHEYKEYHKKYG